jgi:hypothetical protein
LKSPDERTGIEGTLLSRLRKNINGDASLSEEQFKVLYKLIARMILWKVIK